MYELCTVCIDRKRNLIYVKEVIKLEEIEVKDNPLGIKVFVVGKPDIEHMPEEEFDLFVSSLELRVSEYFEKLQNSKER